MPETAKSYDDQLSRHTFQSRADRAPYVKTYDVPVREGMTVLDGLHYIKENLDRVAGLALFLPHGRLRLVRHAAQRASYAGLQHPDPAHRHQGPRRRAAA